MTRSKTLLFLAGIWAVTTPHLATRKGTTMTREARLMSGIILITVPTIQYGGYFLLTSLMNKSSAYMENPL